VYNCCLLQQNFVNTDGHFFSFEVFGFDFSQVEVAAKVEEKASQQAFGQYLGLRSQPAFLSLENKFHLLPVNRGIPSSSGEGADIVAVI